MKNFQTFIAENSMIDIQVQFSAGEWRTINQVPNNSQFIIRGMTAAEKTFKGKRIRAAMNGRVVDIL